METSTSNQKYELTSVKMEDNLTAEWEQKLKRGTIKSGKGERIYGFELVGSAEAWMWRKLTRHRSGENWICESRGEAILTIRD